MFIEERHEQILEMLRREGRIKASDIQNTFDIGFDTARRDLRILEEKGLLKRTHGGAIPAVPRVANLPTRHTPRDITEVRENYLAIAKLAVREIGRDQVVFITAASIGYFMAQNLPAELQFTAVTNSIVIADELRMSSNVTVILAGGEMTPMGQFYDGYATQLVKNIRFDKSFLTSAGFSAGFGMSVQRSRGVAFLQAVIEGTRENIALYPSEKLGAESILRVCHAQEFGTLVTDWDAVEDELTKIEEQGIKVVVAEREPPGA